MEFIEKVNIIAKKIKQQGANIKTEEATKTTLILPFLSQVLGYDVFDLNDVVPEFTADVGTKQGEKVDFAIIKNGKVEILVECKKYGDELSFKHATQLYRYFSVTTARIAILTNGSVYQCYTELEAANKMDERPFLTLNLEQIDTHLLPELKKLSKEEFNADSVISSAAELKYVSLIKKHISDQFIAPDEALVKLLTHKVFDGAFTVKIKDAFTIHTKKAMTQFLNDSVNARLKSAMNSEDEKEQPPVDLVVKEEVLEIEATKEQLEAFNVIKAILRQKFDIHRIVYRCSHSYFSVLLDDNNRKPLCRLFFTNHSRSIAIVDDKREFTKYNIDSIDDIFNYSDMLLLVPDTYM